MGKKEETRKVPTTKEMERWIIGISAIWHHQEQRDNISALAWERFGRQVFLVLGLLRETERLKKMVGEYAQIKITRVHFVKIRRAPQLSAFLLPGPAGS